MVTCLKYHNAPKERVKEIMERICKHRASYIRDNRKSLVGNILSEYPRLIDTDGMIRAFINTCAVPAQSICKQEPELKCQKFPVAVKLKKVKTIISCCRLHIIFTFN